MGRWALARFVRRATVIKVHAVNPLSGGIAASYPIFAVDLRHNVYGVLYFVRQTVDKRRILMGQVNPCEGVALLPFLRGDALFQATLCARVSDASAHVRNRQIRSFVQGNRTTLVGEFRTIAKGRIVFYQAASLTNVPVAIFELCDGLIQRERHGLAWHAGAIVVIL